jgi:hypothetical protein
MYSCVHTFMATGTQKPTHHLWVPSHVWSDPVDRALCTHLWTGRAHTWGRDTREPPDPPVEWPASKAAGKQAWLQAGQRGLLTTLVFSPQQGFEAAPRHLRSVC